MKVQLKNIGLIKDVEYEIGDLTIICGQNNTGKTYAMYALYGFLLAETRMSCVGNTDGDFWHRSWHDLVCFNINPQEIKKVFAKYNKEIITQYADSMQNTQHYEMPITNITFDMFEQIMETVYSNYSNRRMLKDIGINSNYPANDNLTDITNNNFSIKFSKELFQYAIEFIVSKDCIGLCTNLPNGFLLNVKNDKNILHFDIRDNNNQPLTNSQKIILKDLNSSDSINEWLYRAIEDVISTILSIMLDHKFMSNLFIITAERSGVIMFDHDLNITKHHIITKAVQNGTFSSQELQNIASAQYALPVKNNIDFLRDIKQLLDDFPKSALLKDHPEIIEYFASISQGTYNYDQYAGIKFIPNDSSIDCQLSLNESSSSIRALVHLNFYLRHIAQKGDMLMIDEPELNLHPHNQRKMAVLIAMLVNVGIKVMVTTHSNFFINELNSLMMLYNNNNDFTKKIMKQYNYPKLSMISATKVKAYNAHHSNQTVTFTPVIITEYGMQDTGFYDDINEINTVQSRIIQGF